MNADGSIRSIAEFAGRGFGLTADLLRLEEEMTDRFLGGAVFGLSSPRD